MINKELFDKGHRFLYVFAEKMKEAKDFGFDYEYESTFYHFADYPMMTARVRGNGIDIFINECVCDEEVFERFKKRVMDAITEMETIINEIKSKEPYAVQKTEEAAQ